MKIQRVNKRLSKKERSDSTPSNQKGDGNTRVRLGWKSRPVNESRGDYVRTYGQRTGLQKGDASCCPSASGDIVKYL